MIRARTLAIAMGGLAAAAGLVAWHRFRPGGGHEVEGGAVMGDAASYDRYTRLLLGSFFRGIAADVAAVAPAGGRALEVGCGPGLLSTELARRHGLEVTGLDLDPAMIERARANAARVGSDEPRPSFVVGDVASLPFPAASFDVVVSTMSMHHWSDPGKGLAEIGRVVRPGGRALVWDLRQGGLPLHRRVADAAEHAPASGLRVVGDRPWRWPWRLSLVRRVELTPEPGQADREAATT